MLRTSNSKFHALLNVNLPTVISKYKCFHRMIVTEMKTRNSIKIAILLILEDINPCICVCVYVCLFCEEPDNVLPCA